MSNGSDNVLGFISDLGSFREIKGRRNYNYWQKYTYEIKNEDILGRAKAIEKNIEFLIPKINHPRYTHLKDLRNSHLISNRMALELIIRNNEFENLFMKAKYILDKNLYDEFSKEYGEVYKELKSKFGFSFIDRNQLLSLPYFNESTTIEPNQDYLITNPPYISDIENGIYRVIEYYANKKSLYYINKPIFRKVKGINEDEAKLVSENLYVKIDSNSEFIIFSVYNKDKHKRIDDKFYERVVIEEKSIDVDEVNYDFIDKNLNDIAIEVDINGKKLRHLVTNPKFPLELIDRDFINTLKESEKEQLLYVSEQNSFVEYQLPILDLAGSRYVNFLINIDASEKEILENIKKLKLEKNQIKSKYEILGIENRKDEIIDVSNKALSKGNTRIRNFADALYTYDIYKIIETKFEEIKGKINSENSVNKINNIEYQLNLFAKQKIIYILEEIINKKETTIRTQIRLIEKLININEIKNIILGNLRIK